MIRNSLMTAGILLVGASAFAQQNAASRVQPITGPVRNAGVYHLNTGTWTRHATQANLGADIIYNNTCSSTYFSAFSGDLYNDEGRLPSPSGPSNLNNRPGCTTSYLIDGIQIAYCTDQTTGNYSLSFFEAQAGCTSVIGVTPTASYTLALGTQLPAAAVVGTANCWVVTIDAAGGVANFTMQADGDGTYGGGGIDTFSWQMGSTAAGTGTGPFISGDPNTCLGYDGTRWDPTINYAEDGTGMGTQNSFYIEGGVTAPGCYWFGPNLPMASFWLELNANACVPTEPGVRYCSGDGTATACPCGNAGTAGNGCASSINTAGASLGAAGSASLAADTVVLTGAGMPNSNALYFQGTIRQNTGLGNAFGDGLRCAGGTIIRLGTKTNVAGTSSYPTAGNQSVSVRGAITVPGTRTYQAWYRNAAAFCTPSTFNLSNGYEIVWAP
ncbi:MAG: hypothetical protein RL112_1158 [Planctomycetota bacterium]